MSCFSYPLHLCYVQADLLSRCKISKHLVVSAAGDINDPYSSSAVSVGSSAIQPAVVPSADNKSLPDLLEAVAAELNATGARWHSHLGELTGLLLGPLT